MARRQRTDTVKGAVSAMAGALSEIAVPEHVDVPEGAMKFWRSITKARAADRWTDADLEVAAELARTKANIERLNGEIVSEGDIIVNERGTPIVNPKHNLIETLTRRMVALSRMLQVHAEATQGKSRDQVKANQAQADAGKAADEAESDLIPGLYAVK
jgi:hypothetical protein